MRAVVLTSSMRRHQFLANTVAARLEVACVWQEEKSFEPLKYAESADDEELIRRHFAGRDVSEEAYFADAGIVRVPSRRVPAGGCNARSEIAAMRGSTPTSCSCSARRC